MKRACTLLIAFFALAFVSAAHADIGEIDQQPSFAATGPAGLFGDPLTQNSAIGEVGQLTPVSETAVTDEEVGVFAPVPLPLPLTMLALSLAGLLAYRALPSA